jgi:hypothetical protein
VYAAVHCVARGGFRTVELDGARPTIEQFDAFAEVLEAEGIEVRQGGGDAYKLTDPSDPSAKIAAVYVRLAVPPAIDDRALGALLDRATEGFAHPFAWPALAEAIGDEAGIEAHRARAEAYGVEG